MNRIDLPTEHIEFGPLGFSWNRKPNKTNAQFSDFLRTQSKGTNFLRSVFVTLVDFLETEYVCIYFKYQRKMKNIPA